MQQIHRNPTALWLLVTVSVVPDLHPTKNRVFLDFGTLLKPLTLAQLTLSSQNINSLTKALKLLDYSGKKLEKNEQRMRQLDAAANWADRLQRVAEEKALFEIEYVRKEGDALVWRHSTLVERGTQV